jgi:condensin complex subunit 1
LIWHQNEAIRKECLNSFRDVFLSDGSDQGTSLSAQEISRNLIELLQRCNDNKVEIDSLEQIIGELFAKELVDANVITSLWSRLQEDLDKLNAGTAVVGASNIITLLRMITKRLPEIVTMNKVSLLIDIGFHRSIFHLYDLNTLRATCRCLLNIPIKADATTAEVSAKILEPMIYALRRIITGIGCSDANTSAWFSVCEEAIRLAYHVHTCPDHLMANLILPMYAVIADPTVSGSLSPFALARFVYVLGQTASSTLVYAERLSTLAKRATIATTAASQKDTKQDDDAMEEEMGMAQATDAEADRYYLYVTEKQLVLANLLGKFRSMIVSIVTTNHSSVSSAEEKVQYSHPLIRKASTMALCRYMSISNELCEELLPLLFTALERDSDEDIRTMIIVSLGDLAFRFPNAVEPWNGRIYDRLSDSSLLVRYNTLMVLSHLILHDMVKVKGFVSSIVLCLCDKSEMIRDLATLFFTKLAERSNNPIYNLLGDIISTLSTPTSAVTSTGDKRTMTTAEFESAMAFLLSFLKRDK